MIKWEWGDSKWSSYLRNIFSTAKSFTIQLVYIQNGIFRKVGECLRKSRMYHQNYLGIHFFTYMKYKNITSFLQLSAILSWIFFTSLFRSTSLAKNNYFTFFLFLVLLLLVTWATCCTWHRKFQSTISWVLSDEDEKFSHIYIFPFNVSGKKSKTCM